MIYSKYIKPCLDVLVACAIFLLLSPVFLLLTLCLGFANHGQVFFLQDRVGFGDKIFKIQNSKLLLVGPLESELDPLSPETLQEIESNSSIITTGFQDDVRPYFAIANVLTFPSYREGFPNVVMQAGAMGLPSIVSDINGCNEIIEDGRNGLIIPPKDTEALHQVMQRILEDRSLYKQLQNNAREMITSRYEQKLVWEALLMEYRMLLKEKGFEDKTLK